MIMISKLTVISTVSVPVLECTVSALVLECRCHTYSSRVTISEIRYIVYVLGSYGIDQPRRPPPPPTSHSAESSPQHQSNHSSPHHQQGHQGQPGAAGSAGFLSSLKGGAGSLMKNIKDASSKVAHTISQTAS